MSDEQSSLQNTAPDAAPAAAAESQQSGNITVHGSIRGTGIAIGHNSVVQVTTIYEWTRRQPADPQTVEAARLLLERLPTDGLPVVDTLPPGSRAPSRLATFVGREPDLLAIAAALKGGQTTAIGQAASVHGLGGVGKTSVANEFCHRFGAYFAGGVYWLSFAEPANIPLEVAQCGGEGGMQLRPDFHSLPLDEQVAAVQRAWAEAIPRLLVFDNVDTDDGEALVAQWRPPSGGCRVLITSRRGRWDAALGVAALPLGVLPRDESIALLRAFRADLDDDDADAIAAELGDLPLALHLAASFLKTYADTAQGAPQAFLTRLRDPALLEHPALRGRATGAAWSYHERSVARAFALSYERLRPDDTIDALALALLARAAYFAPGEAMPRDLLLATVAEEADDDDAALDAADALGRLVELGLLERDTGGLVLHRLLARFVQGTAPDSEAQAAVERAVIETAYDLNTKGIPTPFLPLLPHLRQATDAALERADEQAATLATNLGSCLNNLFADYAAARPYYERVLAIREAVLGPEHPDTAASLNNLGSLLQAQGDLAGARPYLERALAIQAAVLGPQHPATAQSLNNLGGLLQEMGDLDAARAYMERTLAIFEAMLGPEHSDTATSLNNLGGLLRAQGDLAAARPYYEQALAIREAVLGPQHPDTAQSLNNLAVLCYYEGDLEAAAALMRRALAIRETVLGPHYPDTKSSQNNLAAIEAQLRKRRRPWWQFWRS